MCLFYHHFLDPHLLPILTIFLSGFIKIFEILWKWFEFIHYLFLLKTYVSTMLLYTHVLAIKMLVCWIYAHSLFAEDDNRDIRGLRYTMLQFTSATFLWENTF